MPKTQYSPQRGARNQTVGHPRNEVDAPTREDVWKMRFMHNEPLGREAFYQSLQDSDETQMTDRPFARYPLFSDPLLHRSELICCTLHDLQQEGFTIPIADDEFDEFAFCESPYNMDNDNFISHRY